MCVLKNLDFLVFLPVEQSCISTAQGNKAVVTWNNVFSQPKIVCLLLSNI